MLIIYAHPNKLGHSGEILHQVKKILEGKKIKYEILDLYQIKFDPVLQVQEHYASGNKKISRQVLTLQKKIKKEKQFIFIYPIWWNNPPAILKGFFDKVFTVGFAFKYVHHHLDGLLKGRAVVFSSSGAPRIFAWLVARDRALKAVTKDVLRFCGIKSRAYAVGWANQFNSKQKKEN